MSKERTNKRKPILNDGQHKHTPLLLDAPEKVYVIVQRRKGRLSDVTLTGEGRTGVVLCGKATGESLIKSERDLRGAYLEYIPNPEAFMDAMADAGRYRGVWFARDEVRMSWWDLAKWRELRG